LVCVNNRIKFFTTKEKRIVFHIYLVMVGAARDLRVALFYADGILGNRFLTGWVGRFVKPINKPPDWIKRMCKETIISSIPKYFVTLHFLLAGRMLPVERDR